jgi:hypothetical protein
MSRQLLISGTIQQLRERAILWLEMRTPEHKQNYSRNQLQKNDSERNGGFQDLVNINQPCLSTPTIHQAGEFNFLQPEGVIVTNPTIGRMTRFGKQCGCI